MFNLVSQRRPGTDRRGYSFSDETIQAVWLKGQIVPGKDSAYWRRDQCGALMFRLDYGKTDSIFGWEVDHAKPVSQGGTDDLYNLQPLQWQNNRHKGDAYPTWNCKIGS